MLSVTIFNFIEQVQESTTNEDDVVSTFKAYANYRFENRFKDSIESKDTTQTVKEFTKSHLQKELGEAKLQVRQLEVARNIALEKLKVIFKRANIGAYCFEVLILSLFAFLIHLLNNSIKTTIVVVFGIIFFRIALLIMKDKFGINRTVRNFLFIQQLKFESFYKIHKDDDIYSEKINDYIQKAT